MTPRFKFPTPKSVKLKDRAVLCTADRILSLYNQDSGDIGKRISKKVKKWFAAEAKKQGWAGCHFLPEFQTGHGAGCVLFMPPQQVNVKVTVRSTTLILEAQTGDED